MAEQGLQNTGNYQSGKESYKKPEIMFGSYMLLELWGALFFHGSFRIQVPIGYFNSNN